VVTNIDQIPAALTAVMRANATLPDFAAEGNLALGEPRPARGIRRQAVRERGETNVFHAFYRALVQRPYEAGVSRNVSCVNVDAVIAALLLKAVDAAARGRDRRARAADGRVHDLPEPTHMSGCAAEVDDHLTRGRNMDCTPPAYGGVESPALEPVAA